MSWTKPYERRRPYREVSPSRIVATELGVMLLGALFAAAVVIGAMW